MISTVDIARSLLVSVCPWAAPIVVPNRGDQARALARELGVRELTPSQLWALHMRADAAYRVVAENGAAA